jgi:2-amino-4-hydroxy-6-hydroxymethyldihydropteridine diphosphokinase
MVEACIALGSNQGDSAAIIHHAFQRLQALSNAPIRTSSLWRSTPVDCPPGSPPFINAAVALIPCPGEIPETLLSKLQELEKEFGRVPKKVLNEARPLDLDLIAFGTEVRSRPELTLPHPRTHLRRFVLAPLTEIAPGLQLPGQTTTVRELYEKAPDDPGLVRIS